MVSLPRFGDRLPVTQWLSVGLVLIAMVCTAACSIDLQPVECTSNGECGNTDKYYCLRGTCVEKDDYSPPTDQDIDATEDPISEDVQEDLDVEDEDLPSDPPTDQVSDGIRDSTTPDLVLDRVTDTMLDSLPTDMPGFQ